jgi:hypothetical protein
MTSETIEYLIYLLSKNIAFLSWVIEEDEDASKQDIFEAKEELEQSKDSLEELRMLNGE